VQQATAQVTFLFHQEEGAPNMETFNFAKTQSVSVTENADGNIEFNVKAVGLNCLTNKLVVSKQQAREIAEAIAAIA
jgi:hypothetical protein